MEKARKNEQMAVERYTEGKVSIVDFDRVTEVSTAEGLKENIRRVRGLLFR